MSTNYLDAPISLSEETLQTFRDNMLYLEVKNNVTQSKKYIVFCYLCRSHLKTIHSLALYRFVCYLDVNKQILEAWESLYLVSGYRELLNAIATEMKEWSSANG
jgi:hypothetical protein